MVGVTVAKDGAVSNLPNSIGAFCFVTRGCAHSRSLVRVVNELMLDWTVKSKAIESRTTVNYYLVYFLLVNDATIRSTLFHVIVAYSGTAASQNIV